MAEGLLAGLKILITRPRDQALQLAQAVERQGGIPVLLPLLQIAPVADSRVLAEQVSGLAGAELAIFISPNAVQYGMAAIRTAGGLPGNLTIATVGQGSAQALRELGVENVLLPADRFDSEGLLALPQLQQIAGWRVLIFRGDGGRALLGDELMARGAMVEYVTCYRRSKPHLDERLLADAHAITVTSSEALTHLSQMPGESLRHLPLFVPHPRIAELAHLQGWTEVHQTDSGDEGLLSGLMEWAKNRIHAASAFPRNNGAKTAGVFPRNNGAKTAVAE